MNNSQYTSETRPHGRAVHVHEPRRLRRLNWWVVLLFAALTPVFLCGSGLLLYLIFPPAHTDILILGVDSREGEGWYTRADSIMLVGINPAHLRVSMLSIPRDLFIEVPGYGLQRINTVNVLGESEGEGGGPILTARSIEQSFGVRPERYIRLDFNGFVDLIDAVGGVTIDVERGIVDDFYPTADGGTTTVRFDPGTQHMDGQRALIYARTRHADDDYFRAGRQQQVVSAVLARLINPAYWPAATSALNRNIDTDLSLWDMLALAPPVLANRGRFEQLVIDREYITGTGNGLAVPDYAKLAPWIAERFR